MQILCDKDGYVESFALIGNMIGGVKVTEPEDVGHFRVHFRSYKLAEDGLSFDVDQEQILRKEDEADEIRRRREKECFSVINRGQLWYDHLTEKQRSELDAWYKAWLYATETGAVPDKPEWL